MAIVFEEVTASVEREEEAPREAQPGGHRAPESPEERADALRLALALMAERQLRQRAD